MGEKVILRPLKFTFWHIHAKLNSRQRAIKEALPVWARACFFSSFYSATKGDGKASHASQFCLAEASYEHVALRTSSYYYDDDDYCGCCHDCGCHAHLRRSLDAHNFEHFSSRQQRRLVGLLPKSLG